MQQSESIADIAAALCEFQGAVTGARKGGKNPHFRNNYTRLEDAWAAAREHLHAHGLSVTQWPETGAGGVRITTRIMHKSGQWIEGSLEMPVDKLNAQGVGSAITYGCRYAFLAALGLPPTDDDGEAAAKAAPPKEAKEPRKRQSRGKGTEEPHFSKNAKWELAEEWNGKPLGEAPLSVLDIYAESIQKAIDADPGNIARPALQEHLKRVEDAARAAEAQEVGEDPWGLAPEEAP